MTKQIAVRLPDELVDFLDQTVERGHAGSRAAAVAQAVEWERRREVAARDAEILAGSEGDSDLDELAKFAATVPMDDLE